MRRSAAAIFGNLDELHDFHASCLHPELERCGANPSALARAFTNNCTDLRALYSDQCRNMHGSRKAIEELGGEQNPASILRRCQAEAGHQLPLSSYLLKPMQRLTKYQLMLRDLKDSSNVVCGKSDLEEALTELLAVIRVVNDSMMDVDVSVKGLPNALKQGLGALCCQDGFNVTTTSENGGKSQPSQILFNRNKSQRRHVFLYENYVIFCKPVQGDKNNGFYHFKFSIGTNSLGMSSIVKGEEKKIELWVHGRPELYVLEAKSKKAKEEFAAAIRKVIIRQKEHRASIAGGAYSAASGQSSAKRQQQQQPAVFYDTSSSTTTTASSESSDNHHHARVRETTSSRLSRSRSLENGKNNTTHRSRSLDCGGRNRSSPEDDEDDMSNEDEDHRVNIKYIVLADYMALTSREIDLSEDEMVELVKVGCAGWWYVRLTTYPFLEGWAPSTYLEKVVEA
jgi:hypothetical protein